MSPYSAGDALLNRSAQRRLRAVLLLERVPLGEAPWERKRDSCWRVLDLESGEPSELPEGHLLAFYSRP